jgi:pimeloyl-ACP methyl ester carboxylesterase
MTQHYHLLPVRVHWHPTYKPSYVVRAIAPAKTLIVFVHGFAGSALSTWRNFPTLASLDAGFADADLLFFGYRSLRHQTNSSAANLFSLCSTLFAAPARYLNGTGYEALERPHDHAYERVLFVGHSLGAIVSRRALLTAASTGTPWVANAGLLLFAPAHMGATDVTRLVEVLPKALRAVVALGRWKIQTFAEAEKGSTTLTTLKAHTDKALEHAAKDAVGHLKAFKVVFGPDDDIVDQNEFCADPPLTQVNGNHTSVCKPTVRDPRPLELVKEALHAHGE